MTATVYTLAKGAASLSLVTHPYYMAGDLPIGSSGRSTELLYGDDGPMVGYVNERGERRLPLAVAVRGTTGQGLETSLNSLLALLPHEGETATLTIQRSNGTMSGTLTIIGYEQLECVYGLARDLGSEAVLSVELICDPHLLTATETLYAPATDYLLLPDVASLNGMIGLAAAPVDLALGSATDGIKNLWAGVYPEWPPDTSLFFHEMTGKTWTGGAAAADALGWPDCAGNTLWSDTSDALVTTSIDTADVLPGEYLVLARCKSATVHGDVYCGASAVLAEMLTAHVEATTLEWHALGVVSLPTQAVRGAATAPLYIGIKSLATGTMYINAVALVPTTWGMCGWVGGASHAHALVWEDGIVYADDVASLAKSLGHQLRTLGGAAASVAPTFQVTLGASYVPRWEQLPSASGLPTIASLVAAGLATTVAPEDDTGPDEYL